jgi:hypothetical protein
MSNSNILAVCHYVNKAVPDGNKMPGRMPESEFLPTVPRQKFIEKSEKSRAGKRLGQERTAWRRSEAGRKQLSWDLRMPRVAGTLPQLTIRLPTRARQIRHFSAPFNFQIDRAIPLGRVIHRLSQADQRFHGPAAAKQNSPKR